MKILTKTDLARDLKKLWNIKVSVILILVGVIEMVSEALEKYWRSENEFTQSKPQLL